MRVNLRILAPVRLSDRTEESVEHAVAVANALASHLDLLFLDADEHWDRGKPDGTTSDDLCGGRDIRRSLATVAAASTIAAHGDSISADLVLMTSGRYGTWRGLWKRSLAEDVLNLSGRPVWITAEKNVDRDYRMRTHRILCVVGLDGQETELIHNAEVIAAATGARISLLHVVPETSEGLLHHAVEHSVRPLSVPRAEGKLRAIASCLAVRPTTSVVTGRPGRCIALAAREQSADLVLIARRFAGTQSAYGCDLQSLLPRLYCPLLTVPVDARQTANGDQVSVADSSRVSVATR